MPSPRRFVDVTFPPAVLMVCALVLFALPAAAQEETDPKAKRDVIVQPEAKRGKDATSKAAPAEPPARWVDTLAAAAPLIESSQHPSEHLWVAQILDSGKFTLLHRLIGPKPEGLHRAFTSAGRPIGAAAYLNRLYLVYEDRSVQMVRSIPRQDPQINPFPTTQLPPLPDDAELIAVAASRSGPTVLVRTRPAAAQADQAPADAPSKLRLLRQNALTWDEIALPEGLNPAHARTLVTIDGTTDRMAVISILEGGKPTVHVHELRGDQWTTWEYNQPTHSGTRFAAAGDLYMLRPQTLDPLRLEVLWLRRGAARKVTEFPSLGSPEQWWALGGDNRVLVLVRRGDELAISWYSVIDPIEPSPPIVLEITDVPPPISQPMLMMMSVVMILIVVLILSARRDPQSTLPRLPPNMRIAALARVIAAVIDFAPALVLAMYLYNVRQPGELFVYWPTFTLEWERSIPAMVAIGIFVGHTFLFELLAGASLGKLITGIRVADLGGGRAGPTQVFLRNLAKAVELAVPLLLIVPLMNPHHQRLGDLIGRTVVVHRKPGPPAPGTDGDSDHDADETQPPPGPPPVD